MKFTILICLLGLAIVSANYGNGIGNGSVSRGKEWLAEPLNNNI